MGNEVVAVERALAQKARDIAKQLKENKLIGDHPVTHEIADKLEQEAKKAEARAVAIEARRDRESPDPPGAR